MRQVMPHRNNIYVRRTKRKNYFAYNAKLRITVVPKPGFAFGQTRERSSDEPGFCIEINHMMESPGPPATARPAKNAWEACIFHGGRT